MTACGLLDIPCHLQNVLFGWVAFVPWWGWALAGLVLVGIVWKLAGWPGIIALAGAAGFILGRRSVDPAHEHVDGRDATPPVRAKNVPTRKPRKYLLDRILEGLGKR